MKHIHLKGTIPGPNGARILEKRKASMPAGLAKSTEIVVKKAKGALVWDVDDNCFIDFAGGIGMINAGHAPDEVVNAIGEQAAQYIHTCSLVTTIPPAVELCELLNQATPGDFSKKTLLVNSGAEAVENAVNIAKYYTKRPAVIVFEGAYHGRTLLTMTLTSKYNLFKKGYGSFVSDVYRLPAPNMYRIPEGMTAEQYLNFSLKQLENAFISQVDPSAVAAILIEPIQGEGGFVPMPKAFLQKIRELCTTHGIVMIADEIQCGFGRSGKLFAIEHSEVVPDMITMAKSLGAGMPIGALTGKAEIMDTPHLGAIGGTYSGSPVACVAAIEALKIINTPAFLQKANQVGASIMQRLTQWKQRYPIIGDVRGIGAMCLLEFVKDPVTKEPIPDTTLSIIKEAVANGIILIRAGLYSNCIRLLPPLTITEEQLQEGLDVLESAIKKITAVG
jgi:4-aminobutyrate aminotransferase/(S)-3-amino-2-methylpropionate transaminase